MGNIEIRPISFHEANLYVQQNHRHNIGTSGNKFSIGCYDVSSGVGKLCGVAICCRPIARKLDDGMTLEISRVCTDGTRNACSALYGACCRVAKAMGYKKVITYTLESENGASLKASNFIIDAEHCGGVSWNVPSRPREETQVTLFGEVQKYPQERKTRWRYDI